MKPLPRLLPLVAVSIGGVLALKALNGATALPDLLSAASAHAEAASKDTKTTGDKTAAAGKSAALPSASVLAASASASKPAPACAINPSELAREAGLSPGELQTLQNLQARRGQLDDREKALSTQVQLLAAAETKLDSRLKAMNDVKAQIATLLGQADQQQQADTDRLTIVYEKMKPADAAAVMSALDDKVRIPVAAKMKNAALAAILSKMPTLEAKKLTESLAQRATMAKASVDAAEHAAAAATSTTADSSPDPTAPEAAPNKAKTRRLATARRKPAPATATASAAKPDAAPPASGAAPAKAG